MRQTQITLPELGLVAGTRMALGAGLGLLMADRLSREQRQAAGWALAAIGALTTIPLALDVFGRSRCVGSTGGESKYEEDLRHPSTCEGALGRS